MTTYRIVRLQEPDENLLEQVYTLRAALMAHSGRNTPDARYREIVPRRLADPTMLLALVLADTEAVGYVLAFDVTDHPFMPDWQRSGYITHFYIVPQCRRQGVGQQLFDYVMDWMRTRGTPGVMLNVDPHNIEGNPFWLKQGFRPIATRMRRPTILE